MLFPEQCAFDSLTVLENVMFPCACSPLMSPSEMVRTRSSALQAREHRSEGQALSQRDLRGRYAEAGGHRRAMP